MSKFIFAVSGQVLDLLTPTRGISDTINANSAEFNFRSPDWEGTSKWAHFSNPSYNDGASVDFALINDAIDSSRGLNLPSGIWEVWIHGEVIANGEVIRRLVTETQTIRIIESNIEGNEPLGELNPSVAEQIDAKATEALNARITSSTVDVDSGIGTPSAEVEITGEDGTKNLAFHFHNLKGAKGDPGDKGDKGDTGAQGETGQTGETGATPDLTIGTVTGGETAGATITGTPENPVLNLVLPKGDKGDTGATGQTGPAGGDGVTPSFSIGTVEAGDQAEATITGTDEDPVLNLVLPKGNKGDKGDTPHFTIGTVEDGASSSAAATITGTDEDPVLNLVLPRGPQGEPGESGMPDGGTNGQVLSKASDDDQDVEWRTIKKDVYFGVCSTGPNEQTKIVSIEGVTSIYRGLSIYVYFTQPNYSGAVYLQVNDLRAPLIMGRGYGGVPRWDDRGLHHFCYYDGFWYEDYNLIENCEDLGIVQLYCHDSESTLEKTTTAFKPDSLHSGMLIAIDFDGGGVPAGSTITFYRPSYKPQIPALNIYYHDELLQDGVIKAGDTALFAVSRGPLLTSSFTYYLMLLCVDRTATTDTTLEVEGKPADSKAVGDALDTLEAETDGKLFMAGPALTERVAEGTWLKNSLWGHKVCAQVGYCYDSGESKIRLYVIESSEDYPISRTEDYAIIYKDSQDTEYEMTLENAPNESVHSLTVDAPNEKRRVNISGVTHHVDARFVRVVYSESGDVDDRIYSEQYRYTLEDGVLTRTKFGVEYTDPSHIVDVGLTKAESTVPHTWNRHIPDNLTLRPLVSTLQSEKFKFIIPDSLFSDATYGLMVTAVAGDGSRYLGPTFFKAEGTAKESVFNTEILGGLSAVTERVDGGTWLKNNLVVNKACASVGYCYYPDESILRVYGVMCTDEVPASRRKSYRLYVKDSEDDPYELTLENSPNVTSFSDDADIYKFRYGVSNIQHHVDVRFLRITYDTNGDIIDKIYSEQYRYTIVDGVCTRTRFNVAKTNPTYVIDIGLRKITASSVWDTYATRFSLSSSQTLYPLVSTPQPVQYKYIIPDEFFNGATYGLTLTAVMGDKVACQGPTFYMAEDKVGELEEEVFSAIDANQAEFYAENFFGAPALTERVEGGTLLKNQLWVNNTVSHVGFAYDQDAGKLWFYAVFGYAYKAGWTNKSYVIIYKDSPDPARELTLEDTDYVNEIQNPDWIMKYRAGSTTISHHADVRYCRVVYDENGNEVDTIYSAQYRFTIENGAATRTRFETAPTDPLHIIDMGLLVNNNSVAESFAYADPTITRAIKPLVSTIQTAAFQFIIPDSMFNGAEHGLSVVALTGDLNRYVCATFHKAEDKSPFIVTLTPTAADYSGTMDKTVAEIYAAYQANRKIVFRTLMSGTEHMDTDCTARWFDGSTYPSFNGFILDGTNNLLIFAFTGTTSDGTKATYGTILYPITPAT